jgi:hypothetical protein
VIAFQLKKRSKEFERLSGDEHDQTKENQFVFSLLHPKSIACGLFVYQDRLWYLFTRNVCLDSAFGDHANRIESKLTVIENRHESPRIALNRIESSANVRLGVTSHAYRSTKNHKWPSN